MNYLGSVLSSLDAAGKGIDAYNENKLKIRKADEDSAAIIKKNKEDEEKKAKTQALIEEIKRLQGEQAAETSGYNAAVAARPQIDSAGAYAAQNTLENQYQSGKTLLPIDSGIVAEEANAKFPSLGNLPGQAARRNVGLLGTPGANLQKVSDIGASGYTMPPKPTSTPESIQSGADASDAMKRDIQNKAAANVDYGKLSLQAASRLSPAMANAGLTEKDVPLLGTLKDQSAQQERGKERQVMADATKSNNEATNAQREADRISREEGRKTDQELRRLAIEGQNNRSKGYGIYSDLSEEERQALSNAIDNGLDPYKVNSRTGKLYAQQELLKPGRKWNELAADAAFQRGTGPMNTKALLNSIEPTLTNLEGLGMELKNTMFPGVNKVVNFFKEQSGDPKVVEFNNARDDAIAEVERGLMGTGVLSDSKYLRAVKNVNTAQSPEQFSSAIKQMKFVIEQRLDALHKGPNYKPKQEGTETDQRNNSAGPINLTGDKAKRLEELRRKAAEGTIK